MVKVSLKMQPLVNMEQKEDSSEDELQIYSDFLHSKEYTDDDDDHDHDDDDHDDDDNDSGNATDKCEDDSASSAVDSEADDSDDENCDHDASEEEQNNEGNGILESCDDETSSKNKESSSEQNSQQIALANVMGSLLSKKKKDHDVLSKAKKDKDRKDAPMLVSKRKKKQMKRKRDEMLEVIGTDGKMEKIRVEDLNKKAKAEVTEEDAIDGKRHFPMNKRTDPYCQDPRIDTDPVKERKLRTLATQGVVQLFNTLEQYRQHNQLSSSGEGGKGGGKGGGNSTHQQSRLPRGAAELSAITSGRSGMIDFLTNKAGRRSLQK